MLPSEKVFHLRARPIISDHFPIMCLGACERGMRNNVSGPRLTTGLKRDGRYAIRRGPASPFLEENEWNGEWFLLRFVTTCSAEFSRSRPFSSNRDSVYPKMIT